MAKGIYHAPWEKSFDRILTPLEQFIHKQTTSGILLMIAAISISVGMGVLAAAGNVPIALVGAFLIGLAGAAFMTAMSTLLQTSVAPEFRGRVTSVFMLIVQLFPLGWLIGGVLAEAIGPRETLVAGAIVTLALTAVTFWRTIGLQVDNVPASAGSAQDT